MHVCLGREWGVYDMECRDETCMQARTPHKEDGCVRQRNEEHTPVVLDRVSQLLTEARASGRVRGHHHVPLVGECLGIPAGAPGVSPGALRTTVDEEEERVFLALVEAFGEDEVGVDLVICQSRTLYILD